MTDNLPLSSLTLTSFSSYLLMLIVCNLAEPFNGSTGLEAIQVDKTPRSVHCYPTFSGSTLLSMTLVTQI